MGDISDKSGYITVGRIYTAEKDWGDSIRFIDNNGKLNTLLKRRFVLVPETSEVCDE